MSLNLHTRWILHAVILILITSNSVLAQSVTVDFSVEKQHIRGFGGVNMPGWIDDLTPDQVDKAFGNDPGQIGLSILRVRVPFNSNAFGQEVQAALQARSHGAIIIASPWTPPAWMKTNNNLIGGSLSPSSYGDYAAHLIGFSEFMASNGVPIHAISLQNEPDIQVSYESCDWTPAEMISFLSLHGSEFDALRLIVAESYNFNKSKTDPILNDSTAEPYVDIIGGHIYGGGLSDYPLARSKGKEVWMTEHLDTDTSWTAVLATGKEIQDCMLANYNAYIWWYVRRFYGPLHDNGSISKRGYVVSQFAKFVRPGFKRVDATANPAPGIFVSAYKKDTNAVIVVVNQNPAGVELGFTLQNASVDSITKFTTSVDKDVLNEGTIVVSGNSFIAGFEAQSITTLSTYKTNGGRAMNVPPAANAATYPEFPDKDNNGMESVTLDASSSIDPDGTITNYTWSEEGMQIASGAQAEVPFSTGTHYILLTVTDNDGATDTNLAVIVVSIGGGSNESNVWLEAECGTVGSNWMISEDPNASGGEYAGIQPGKNSIDNPPESDEDQIVFSIDIVEPGAYFLWGRTRVPTPDDDSYWVKMDAGSWAKWNSIPGGNNWQWDDVHNSDMGGGALTYHLTAGTHILTLGYREDGASLDKLYLTNTGTTPSGLGGVEGNCPVDASETNPVRTDITGTQLFANRPNPFSENTLVELVLDKAGYVVIDLLDMTGKRIRTLISGNRQAGRHEFILEGSMLESGIYLLRMQTSDFGTTRRMMVIR